jgi:hypothetical protein
LKNMFFKYTQRSGEETLLLGHTAIPRGCWLLFPFSYFSFAHVCLLERQRKPFKSDAYKMYKDRKSWKQRLYVRDLGHQTKRSSLDQAFWPWNTLNNYIMPSHRSPFESDACKDKGRKNSPAQAWTRRFDHIISRHVTQEACREVDHIVIHHTTEIHTQPC